MKLSLIQPELPSQVFSLGPHCEEDMVVISIVGWLENFWAHFSARISGWCVCVCAGGGLPSSILLVFLKSTCVG